MTTNKFKEQNRLFAQWTPLSLDDFFLSYLQKYCLGETTGKQWRNFLYALRDLEEKNITLLNPKGNAEKELHEELKRRFGNNLENYCIRSIITTQTPLHERQNRCDRCKNDPRHHTEWMACQENQKEIQALKKGENLE